LILLAKSFTTHISSAIWKMGYINSLTIFTEQYRNKNHILLIFGKN